MKWKLNKKILISSVALIGALSLTALVVVSCSSTPSPTFPISVKLGTTTGPTFTIQNGRVTSSAMTIDGVSYTSPPNFDKDKFETQKARAVYDVIANFGVWLYGSSNSLSTFISRMPTTKNRPNPVVDAKSSIVTSGLDFALSAFLGSGAATYQLGIQEINVGDIQDLITSNVKQFDDKTLLDTEPSDNIVTITVPDIEIKYNWWRTEGGSKISWISNNEFNSISKSSFNNSILDAKQTYSLSLNNISFEVTRYAQNSDKKWYPNGVLAIEQGEPKSELPFYFAGLDKSQVKKLFDEINEANKAASGDYSDETFNQALNKYPNLKTSFAKIFK